MYLGIALIVVVVVTGFVTYYQNSKSDAIMDAFKNFIPPKTKVLRNGTWINVDAAKV